MHHQQRHTVMVLIFLKTKKMMNIYLNLFPLNLYGWSKHIFDRLILKKQKQPPQIVGLKFFNVYGPNENHKKI